METLLIEPKMKWESSIIHEVAVEFEKQTGYKVTVIGDAAYSEKKNIQYTNENQIKLVARLNPSVTQGFRSKEDEFDFNKGNVILRIKTIDKLFEYYCLHRLLQMFVMAGFDIEVENKSMKNFKYKKCYEPFVDENIANTFILVRDSQKVTLYFQPIIYSDVFENGIELFRTTDFANTFCPDFLIKVYDNNKKTNYYAILDSKYSTRKTIKDYELKDMVLNYTSQLSGINPDSIKMMWLLQGRIDETKTYYYHNSPLAKKYRPNLSIGICSINTKVSYISQLWKELQTCFDFL